MATSVRHSGGSAGRERGEPSDVEECKPIVSSTPVSCAEEDVVYGIKILHKKHKHMQQPSEEWSERVQALVAANAWSVIAWQIARSLPRLQLQEETIQTITTCVRFFARPELRVVLAVGAHPRAAQELFNQCRLAYERIGGTKFREGWLEAHIWLLRASALTCWGAGWNQCPERFKEAEKQGHNLKNGKSPAFQHLWCVREIVENNKNLTIEELRWSEQKVEDTRTSTTHGERIATAEAYLLLALRWLGRARARHGKGVTFELNESKRIILKASTELRGVRCDAMQMLCEEAIRLHGEDSYAWSKMGFTYQEHRFFRMLWTRIHTRAKRAMQLSTPGGEPCTYLSAHW